MKNIIIGGSYLFNIKENELVLFSIFDKENKPIGKTQLIKSIFLFSKLLNVSEIFRFSGDLFGPNEADNCITVEIDRHNYIISDYDNDTNVYYFEQGFFNKYRDSFIQKIESNPYLKLLNGIINFMKCGNLSIKIALIYSIFPEFTIDSQIKEDLKPFISNKQLMNNYLRDLLNLIPLEIFSDIFNLIKTRLEPFIILNKENREKLIQVMCMINDFNDINSIYPILNSLILSVTDINYKYLLEYILFLLKNNSNEIKSDTTLRQSLLISMLKLKYESNRKIVHNLTNEFRNKKLNFTALV